MRDQRSHPKVIILRPSSLKRAPGKYYGPEIIVDSFEQRPSRSMVKPSSAGVLIAPVAINAGVFSGGASAGAAECFDGEDVTLFHALAGSRLDERHLLVAVDFVAEDVVAGDAADGFDWDSLSV